MKIKKPKRGAELTPEQSRYATCIHEAAHAVMVYYCGSWIDSKGCYVDGPFTGMTHYNFKAFEKTPEVQGLVGLAGMMAERKYIGGASSLHWFEAHLLYSGAVKEGHLEQDIVYVWKDAERAGSKFPHCVLARWSRVVSRIIHEPAVNESIVKVADALYVSSGLHGNDVEKLISVEVFSAFNLSGHKRMHPFCGTLSPADKKKMGLKFSRDLHLDSTLK